MGEEDADAEAEGTMLVGSTISPLPRVLAGDVAGGATTFAGSAFSPLPGGVGLHSARVGVLLQGSRGTAVATERDEVDVLLVALIVIVGCRCCFVGPRCKAYDFAPFVAGVGLGVSPIGDPPPHRLAHFGWGLAGLEQLQLVLSLLCPRRSIPHIAGRLPLGSRQHRWLYL